MKLIQTLLLSLICFVNIGWMWHSNPLEDQYLDKANEARQAGNLVQAMHYYQLSLDVNPKNPEALNLLGVTYEESGLSQKAEEKYLNAIKIDRNFLSSYFNLGVLYWNQQKIDKSIYYFKKRIQLGNPLDPWTIKAKKALNHILSKIDMNRFSQINNDLDQWESNGLTQDNKIVEQALDREVLMDQSITSSKEIKMSEDKKQDPSDSKDKPMKLKPWLQKGASQIVKRVTGTF